jgi:hypothetical protein
MGVYQVRPIGVLIFGSRRDPNPFAPWQRTYDPPGTQLVLGSKLIVGAEADAVRSAITKAQDTPADFVEVLKVSPKGRTVVAQVKRGANGGVLYYRPADGLAARLSTQTLQPIEYEAYPGRVVTAAFGSSVEDAVRKFTGTSVLNVSERKYDRTIEVQRDNYRFSVNISKLNPLSDKPTGRFGISVTAKLTANSANQVLLAGLNQAADSFAADMARELGSEPPEPTTFRPTVIADVLQALRMRNTPEASLS